jgi:hypothetical protein
MFLDGLDRNLLAPGILAIGGILLGLGGVLFGAPRPGSRTHCAGFLAITLLALAAAFDERRWIWQPLLLLAGLWTAFQVLRTSFVREALRRLLSLGSKPRVQAGFILLVAFVGLGCWVQALERSTTPEPSLPEFDRLSTLPNLAELDQQVCTDAGRRIPLHRVADSLEQEATERHERKMLQNRNFPFRVIRTGEADWESNCHGWVFAQGYAWVRGASVDAILEDNGYAPTTTPGPGDLVVYRNEQGEVLHSALVRANSAVGLLVESKWGCLGRFLHRPEDQVYSQTFAFYHTPRGTHLLRGIEGTPSTRVRGTVQGG